MGVFFRRKAYDELVRWKKEYADQYAVLLEGARRVGKSTIAEHFARKEYRSYILIDFATVSDDIRGCFDSIGNIDLFFLRLQAVTGITLYEHESVIIFDEVQLFPRARQAIKFLVKDGRYHYIEIGSLISIRKNVQNILIPSEEMKITVYPMDYEEFLLATGKGGYHLIRRLYKTGAAVGQKINIELMRTFRLYMAVGGMPQAVEAYLDGKNFSQIDIVKRNIIRLYEDDFRKLDPSGRVSAMYHAIPAQLSRDFRQYRVNRAVKEKRRSKKADELLCELLDSKTVNICYHVTDPGVSLLLTEDLDSYKLYIGDTGLFFTLMFMDRLAVENEIYSKLLSDHLPANLGYFYENAVAQIIVAAGRVPYYHTWEKKGSTHYYEVDFLISQGSRVTGIEVKSSGIGKHESLSAFKKQYRQHCKEVYVISQKDVGDKDGIKYLPVYMLPCLLEDQEISGSGIST